jgi:hypothetical protein
MSKGSISKKENPTPKKGIRKMKKKKKKKKKKKVLLLFHVWAVANKAVHHVGTEYQDNHQASPCSFVIHMEYTENTKDLLHQCQNSTFLRVYDRKSKKKKSFATKFLHTNFRKPALKSNKQFPFLAKEGADTIDIRNIHGLKFYRHEGQKVMSFLAAKCHKCV